MPTLRKSIARIGLTKAEVTEPQPISAQVATVPSPRQKAHRGLLSKRENQKRKLFQNPLLPSPLDQLPVNASHKGATFQMKKPSLFFELFLEDL